MTCAASRVVAIDEFGRLISVASSAPNGGKLACLRGLLALAAGSPPAGGRLTRSHWRARLG